MKKLISFLAFSFSALAVNAQATHNMRVTFNDGKYVVFGMDSVKTVEFEEKMEDEAKTTYTINGVEYPMPEAVDLGLPSGTLWANMDLGAKSMYDYGGYFRWGDIEDPNDDAFNKGLGMDYDIPFDIAGTAYDYIYLKTSGFLVMPSRTQFEELIEYCETAFITVGDKTFCKFTSKINNNSILFPIRHVDGTTMAYAEYDYSVYWTDTYHSRETSVIPNNSVKDCYSYTFIISTNSYSIRIGYHGNWGTHSLRGVK